MTSFLRTYVNGRSIRLAVMAVLLGLMTTVSPAESQLFKLPPVLAESRLLKLPVAVDNKLFKLKGSPPACPTGTNVVCCGPT
jgi:hypothetical protein